MTTFLLAANRLVFLPTARKRIRFAQLLTAQIRYQRQLRAAFAPAGEQFYRVDASLVQHPNFR